MRLDGITDIQTAEWVGGWKAEKYVVDVGAIKSLRC